jgi:hypothetical protein
MRGSLWQMSQRDESTRYFTVIRSGKPQLFTKTNPPKHGRIVTDGGRSLAQSYETVSRSQPTARFGPLSP